jgi:hypothetical protein
VLAAFLGVVLGLGMLTKISTLVVVALVFAAGALQVWWEPRPMSRRAKRAAPWGVAAVALLLTCGWYFGRNQSLYGKAILFGYDGLDAKTTPNIEGTPYLDRRPLGFFIGWSNDVFVFPHWPSGVEPSSRFWPVLITDTFGDFLNYAFVKFPEHSTIMANSRPVRPDSLKFARASAAGGVVIALATAIAWLYVGRALWRRRDLSRLLLLLAPAAAVLGLLHFVVKYPFDYQGPIKGMYLQFASAPLFALFGLALSWSASRRATLPLFVIQGLALAAVTIYTFYARMTWL